MFYTGEQSGLSTAAIIGIVVGVFLLLFIIVDVTCYVKNKCGLLMCIREKVGGSRGDDGYSAAKTDDVENLYVTSVLYIKEHLLVSKMQILKLSQKLLL